MTDLTLTTAFGFMKRNEVLKVIMNIQETNP